MANEYTRDPHLTGRKSGRVAPNIHHRIPAREATLVKHGLMSQGDADPRQGAMFNADQITGSYTRPYDRSVYEATGRGSHEPDLSDRSPAGQARAAGVAPPLASSSAGFLPGIEGNKTRSAHRRKMEALASYTASRNNAPLPNANPNVGATAQTIEHIQGIWRGGRDTDWYAGSDEHGHVTEGKSTSMLRDVAQATGHGMTQTVRAAAQMSPRMPWSDGNPLHRTYPNVEVTQAVGHSVNQANEEHHGDPSIEHLEEAGRNTPGQGLPMSKERAAVSFGRPGTASEPLPAGANYGKVPNFNESINFSREELPTTVRQAYAGSYVQDAHDLNAHGFGEGLHSRQGQYAISAMLGSRAAFKNRELPPNFQASVWERVRPPEPLTASSGGPHGPIEHPSLFKEDSAGKLSPQFDFTTSSRGDLPDLRSDTAKRLGLDF